MQPVLVLHLHFQKQQLKKSLHKLLYYHENLFLISLSLQFFEIFLLDRATGQTYLGTSMVYTTYLPLLKYGLVQHTSFQVYITDY